MKARVVYRSKKARYFRGSERRQWDAPSAAPKAPIHQPRVPDGAMPPVKARTGRENYAACGVARHRLVGHGLAGHGPALRYLLHPIGVSDGVCAETVTRAAPWPRESDPVGVDGRADGDSIETPPHPTLSQREREWKRGHSLRSELSRAFGSTEGARFISPRAKPRVSDGAMPPSKAPTGRDNHAACHDIVL